MQVGDLVVLSSAGEKISANWAHRSEMGVVLKIYHTYENPYQIKWITSTVLTGTQWFKRYEIKKLRVKK